MVHFCSVTIDNVVIQGGAAMAIDNRGQPLQPSASTDRDFAGAGGAFDVSCGELTLVGSVVRNNTAIDGGAFVVRGEAGEWSAREKRKDSRRRAALARPLLL